MKNKGILSLVSGIIALLAGVLVFIFEADLKVQTIRIMGVLIIALAVLKFFSNTRYAKTKKLTQITIGEFVLVLALGIITLMTSGKSYTNYIMGSALYISSLSYFWQLNTRSGYTINKNTFILNVMLITIGSNLLLSSLDLHKLLMQIATCFTIYGAVIVIFYIVRDMMKKK